MTKHVTPPTSGPFLSGYSANENAGDTTQIRGAKNPTQARTKSPVSSGVLWLAATLTLRLRRPCGARMTTSTSVAASTSAFATHGFMAEHVPFRHSPAVAQDRTTRCLEPRGSGTGRHVNAPVLRHRSLRRERVLEVVDVLAVWRDIDRQLAGDALQLAGARIRN